MAENVGAQLARLFLFLEAKNQKQLAEKIGVSPARISSAKKKGVPHEWLVKLNEDLGLNPNWLLTGKGPMKIEPDRIVSEEGEGKHEEGGEDFQIHEMLTMTSRVLESRTVYRSALAANIRAFYKAVETEGEMSEIREELRQVREQMSELMEMIRSLGGDVPEKKSLPS